MKYVAFTVKGLEQIALKELETRLIHITHVNIRDKCIFFESTLEIEEFKFLRTIDDISIVLNEFENISSLEHIEHVFNQINFEIAQNHIRQYRHLDSNFSITCSIAKSKTLKQIDVVQKIESVISVRYKWMYTEQNRSNFDIRFFVDGTTGFVSVRLFEKSNIKPEYRSISRLGVLRPSIAAAMILLVRNKNDKKISLVDNFCGSGTILCEATLMGIESYGGDIDPSAVSNTLENIGNISKIDNNKIKVLDALNTKWPNKYFDTAVSNLPWDKQISVNNISDLYKNCLKEYARIVKPNARLCFIVTKPEIFLKYCKIFFPNHEIVKYKLGLLGQEPTIIFLNENTNVGRHC